MILWQAVGACAILLASAFGGWWVQSALPSQHRSRDTVDAVRLVMTMLLTISAVVLGLLTSSAKARYDSQNADVERYSVDLIELDQRLRQYGSDTLAIRNLLRAYTAAAIADTWPDEQRPPGSYPAIPRDGAPDDLESPTLGDMLSEVDRMVEQLTPSDAFHQQIAARLRDRSGDSLQQRWRLLASSHPTLSWPFLSVMMFWLVIIFAIFGLSSPHNFLVYTVVVLCAVSVSSSLYVILDFDSPASGLTNVSSGPLRNSLSHMDRPPVVLKAR